MNSTVQPNSGRPTLGGGHINILQHNEDNEYTYEQSVSESSDDYSETTDSSIPSADSLSDEDSEATNTGQRENKSKTYTPISPWVLRNIINKNIDNHKYQ